MRCSALRCCQPLLVGCAHAIAQPGMPARLPPSAFPACTPSCVPAAVVYHFRHAGDFSLLALHVQLATLPHSRHPSSLLNLTRRRTHLIHPSLLPTKRARAHPYSLADTPDVTTALLKFMAEFVLNKTQRLTFDPSSPNGILLFREVSKVIVAYGNRALQLGPASDPYGQVRAASGPRHLDAALPHMAPHLRPVGACLPCAAAWAWPQAWITVWSDITLPPPKPSPHPIPLPPLTPAHAHTCAHNLHPRRSTRASGSA